MPLLNVTAARDLVEEQQTYGAGVLSSADGTTAVAIAKIPANCYIIPALLGAGVTTVWNNATTQQLTFSTTPTGSELGTVDPSALGFLSPTALASAVYRTTAETTVYVRDTGTGEAATTGKADCIVQWVRLPETGS